MIIVRLIGGLGNQFFQYAVARHLAEIRQTVLKIDISAFETYKLHKYSLWAFNIRENFASPEEAAALRHIKEKHFHFSPDTLCLSDDVYLEGYWQSEKNFANIAGIIRQEFTVKTPLSSKNEKLAEHMASCESVSIHIRRKDYATGQIQILDPCTTDYYFRCVECLVQSNIHPHFFVFSDDMEWVQDNIKLPYPVTLVDHNGADKNYEDLRLMSLCRHNIIANSSFSWWGAWLNNNHNKIICAPKKWFNENTRNSSKDMIPSSWIQL